MWWFFDLVFKCIIKFVHYNIEAASITNGKSEASSTEGVDQALKPLESIVSQINDIIISVSTPPLNSTGTEDHVPDIDKKIRALKKKKPFPTRQYLQVGGHQESTKINNEIGDSGGGGRTTSFLTFLLMGWTHVLCFQSAPIQTPVLIE
ncbi:hypothetical protein L1887_31163 [Cichorium endivia]|nr:hypothetical protein L1887_31163 [Cichorium endivia]